MWAIFGLSPHKNDNQALDIILENHDNSPPPNNLTNFFDNMNSTNNHSHTINDVISWVDDNKFLLTLMILFTIGIISLIINWMYALYKRKVIRRWFINFCNKRRRHYYDDNNKYSEQFASVRKQLSNQALSKYKTSGYTNFLIKVITLCYCNLCTITNSQLVNLNTSSIAIGFLAISTALLFEIGFPIYIYKLLTNSTNRMFGEEFAKKYGSLYLNFKPKDNRFIIVILIKQMMYSILINLNSRLSLTQNTLMLMINLIFLIIIVRHSPYQEYLDYIQSIIMGFSTIAISGFNYVFLFVNNDQILHIFKILNWIIHIGTFSGFIILQLYKYCRKRQPTIEHTDADENMIEIIVQNPILQERSEYTINTIKFKDQLDMNEIK
jgi:hypothetical protein